MIIVSLRAHDVFAASRLRQCDVMTSYWRRCDVIGEPCGPDGALSTVTLASHWARDVVAASYQRRFDVKASNWRWCDGVLGLYA